MWGIEDGSEAFAWVVDSSVPFISWSECCLSSLSLSLSSSEDEPEEEVGSESDD